METTDRAAVEAMAARPEVARIEPLVWIRSSVLPVTDPVLAPSPAAVAAVEWNISRVKAPQVWRTGDTGQGIVLGNIDTGQQWDHPALKSHYRGWNGSTADHNYSWYDEIQPADRAQILRELRDQMREEAARSGLLDTVESSLRTRLRDLLGAESASVAVRVRAD